VCELLVRLRNLVLLREQELCGLVFFASSCLQSHDAGKLFYISLFFYYFRSFIYLFFGYLQEFESICGHAWLDRQICCDDDGRIAKA
jgi:hypothetical protein